MSKSPSRASIKFRLVAAAPAGVTETTGKEIGRKVKAIFKGKGLDAKVRSLRFVPSTRTSLEGDQFQVVANTTVELAAGGVPRAETVDSVVTIDGDGVGQHLRNVSIPLLQR